ncbi:MAG TPA: D-glycerate dehydrogenase [Bryobacteraceae bacterium]|nr:D-glycerate dehydrogenase [Bryobacteraceae bacterium]
MRPSILITKRLFPETVAFLEQHADVDYVPTADGLTSTELIARARGKQAIISQFTDSLSSEVIAQLKGLGMIAHVGVGFDNIDVAAATAHGILVSNTPGVLDDTTADFAFALLLAAARRVTEADAFVRSGQWKRWSLELMIGHDIHHRTLGILGMGRIGQAVARRAAGFSMRVLYHNRTRVAGDFASNIATWVSKDELLAESDFLSIHVPLNESTRHAIGEAELRCMKPTAILINTARGPVVDEAALAKALSEHWIAAAGLDVFEREPEVHPALLACSNAVLAPHIGSASNATRRKMTMMAAENALAALTGKRPPNLLNPAVWDSWASRPEGAG